MKALWSWIDPKRPGDSAEKEIHDLTQRIQSALPDSDCSQFYVRLENFIPRFATTVVRELLDKISAIIKSQESDYQTRIAIFHFLSAILGDTSGDDAIAILSKHPQFLPSLFTDAMPFDSPRIRLISAIWDRQRSVISGFIGASPSFLLPLIRVIPNLDDPVPFTIVCELIHADVSLLPQLGPRLVGSVQRTIKDFPVCLVSQFLAAAPVLRSELRDNLDEWLLSQARFGIADVRQFLESFPGLWNRKASLHLILHADGSRGTNDLDWIAKLPPHDFEIESDEFDSLVQRFLHPPVQLFTVSCGFTSQKRLFNPGAELAVLFLRIFAKIHPVRFPAELLKQVFVLVNDPHDFVAAAAAQTVILWRIGSDLIVPSSLVYKAASTAADETKSAEYRALFRALLKALSLQCPLAVSILLNDRDLVFKPSDIPLLNQAAWRFPQLESVLGRVKEMIVPAMQDSLKVLGCVVSLLGAVIE
jgi:hypothetical protein